MRLSQWREQAPVAECVSAPVMALIEALFADLGVDEAGDCWVVWGEDPTMRYSILAPSLAGLAIVSVRPMGSADGPRGNGKLVRWSKLSVSELTIESSGGHRIVAVQIENHVLKGVDEEADRICGFVRILLAGLENRSEAVAPVVALAAPGHVVTAQVEAATPRAARKVRLATADKPAPQALGAALAPKAPAALPPVASAPETIVQAAETANVELSAPGSDGLSDEGEAAASVESLSREELAAKRRAAAAALLAADLAPANGAEGSASPIEAGVPFPAAEPEAPMSAPTRKSGHAGEAAPEPTPVAAPEPMPVVAPEPMPAIAPDLAPTTPPSPVLPLPPIPGREAWVPPHPILEAEPAPRKPKRWNP